MGKSIFFSGAGHQKNGFFDDLGVLTSALRRYVMVEGGGEVLVAMKPPAQLEVMNPLVSGREVPGY